MKSKKLQRELNTVPQELHDLFQAVREMNTFVCECCHSEELNNHPTLGNVWNFEWFVAMAKLANENGWKTIESKEEGFFDHFKLIGPNCTNKIKNNT